MTIQQEIKRHEQSITRCEKALVLEKLKKRRMDTRKKIELGGLVLKANMGDYDKAVILGSLCYVSKLLREEEYQNLFQLKGQNFFK